MKIRALLCLLLFWGLATGGGARAASGDVQPKDGVTPVERAKRAGNPQVTALLLPGT